MRSPSFQDISIFQDKSTLISFIYPVQNKALVDELAKKQANVFAMGSSCASHFLEDDSLSLV